MATGSRTFPICVCGFALAVAACGERTSGEETAQPAEPQARLADCVQRFAKAANLWGEEPVRASFFYDATALEGDPSTQFLGGNPTEVGVNSITTAHGNSDAAQASFLEAGAQEGTAMFLAEDKVIFRVNEGPGRFDEVTSAGCNRLRDGVTIIQVSFSRPAA